MRRVRQHLSYANVMATLAVFLVLGGGSFAVAALSGHDKNVVKRIANKQITRREPRLSVKHASSANRASPAGAAGGDLSGNYPDPQIGPDAVGPAEIADTQRSVSLPLGSFVDSQKPEALGFNAADTNLPKFATLTGRLVIEWDDDSDGAGPDVAADNPVQTTFTVPPDYGSGGSYLLEVSKDANTTGVPEEMGCQESIGDETGFSSADDVDIPTATLATYALDPPFGTYSAGAAVAVRCFAGATIGHIDTAHDDVVFLHSAEFVYNAAQ